MPVRLHTFKGDLKLYYLSPFPGLGRRTKSEIMSCPQPRTGPSPRARSLPLAGFMERLGREVTHGAEYNRIIPDKSSATIRKQGAFDRCPYKQGYTNNGEGDSHSSSTQTQNHVSTAKRAAHHKFSYPCSPGCVLSWAKSEGMRDTSKSSFRLRIWLGKGKNMRTNTSQTKIRTEDRTWRGPGSFQFRTWRMPARRRWKDREGADCKARIYRRRSWEEGVPRRCQRWWLQPIMKSEMVGMKWNNWSAQNKKQACLWYQCWLRRVQDKNLGEFIHDGQGTGIYWQSSQGKNSPRLMQKALISGRWFSYGVHKHGTVEIRDLRRNGDQISGVAKNISEFWFLKREMRPFYCLHEKIG